MGAVCGGADLVLQVGSEENLFPLIGVKQRTFIFGGHVHHGIDAAKQQRCVLYLHSLRLYNDVLSGHLRSMSTFSFVKRKISV